MCAIRSMQVDSTNKMKGGFLARADTCMLNSSFESPALHVYTFGDEDYVFILATMCCPEHGWAMLVPGSYALLGLGELPCRIARSQKKNRFILLGPLLLLPAVKRTLPRTLLYI